ncbi:hypothetical protein CEE45_07730 [Candidatus Heimdallarchaeota archaeon B3_Heim]|nr:MAG: hypothetical protein CEE45_07730 [Candidatus Heimdallarchaeota archaeon B3_Heim]
MFGYLIRSPMPHFGLMDSEEMKPDEASLLRARLHIRGGKRRLSQGKYAAGVAALHDALIHGMQWFLLSTHPELVYTDADCDITDDETLLQLIQKTPIFADPIYKEDFEYLSEILNQALNERMNGFDKTRYMRTLHNFMKQLEVEPFSDSDLPPEDPATY